MPFFDPLTSWIIILIADGVGIIEEKSKGPSKSELDRKHIKQSNDILNADIRRIKEKYGLVLADMAYDQIKLHIKITREGSLFQSANGQIELTPDNQDYIIEVLEKCVNDYSKYSYPEAKTKYQYYKNVLIREKEAKINYIIDYERNKIFGDCLYMDEPIFAKWCIKYAFAFPIFLLILPYLLGGTLGDIGAYFQLVFMLDIIPIISYICFYNYKKKKYSEWKELNKKFNKWEKEERCKLRGKYGL